MANPYRGEVAVGVDGRAEVLRLSLGALVELEAALGADSLLGLVERVEAGRLSARDVLAVLAAGFRGAGRPEDAERVGEMSFDGGAVGAAQAAASLLVAAFTGAPGDWTEV
jgi:hypothetical protein